MSFEKNVFINCPFDNDYKIYVRPLIFTILYCNLNPKLSQIADSGSVRIRGIVDLIKTSKYSIHDLSRMEAQKIGELARFNMPFELGLDVGSRIGTNGKLSKKQCLIIIEKEKFRYQKVISDIAGNDIECYDSDPSHLVHVIRRWLTIILKPNIPSGSLIWEEYNEFYFDFTENLKLLGFKKKDFDLMGFEEFIHHTQEWITARKR